MSAAPRLPVYLDYAATTPVDPAVARAMQACLEADDAFGNPSSATHAYGRRARELVETARGEVAALIGAESEEIVFTSGATESNNLAILGVARAGAWRGRHIVTARIEHKSVLDPCRRLEKEGFTVTWVEPDRSGRIDPQAVRAALRPDTVLVSIAHANNETGVVQDIAAIGAVCREHDVPFHSDAAQSAGRLRLDVSALPVDFLSFTAHKMYGPKGIGALFVRRAARPRLGAVSFGGGQERGLRPGTLPTHQIVGFGAACRQAAAALAGGESAAGALRERLWRGLAELGGVHLNGDGAPRLPELLNVSFEGVEGESLVTGLTELAVSTGAACDSATGEPSYVLRALGRSPRLAQSSLRFSFGRFTTPQDIDLAVSAVRREVRRLRSISPAGGTEGGPERVDESPPPSGADPLGPAAPYFRTLPGAGTFPDGTGVVRGEAGAEASGAWVRFHLRTEGRTVRDARFQAYGCPHTLAAASWLAGQLPGRARDDLVPGAPQEWAERLAVPVEKLGRLLVVEDALRACLQRWR